MNDYNPISFWEKKPGKACEARPVDDKASKVWRRGQNIQGECRIIFWAPQEYVPERKIQPLQFAPANAVPLSKGTKRTTGRTEISNSDRRRSGSATVLTVPQSLPLGEGVKTEGFDG